MRNIFFNKPAIILALKKIWIICMNHQMNSRLNEWLLMPEMDIIVCRILSDFSLIKFIKTWVYPETATQNTKFLI